MTSLGPIAFLGSGETSLAGGRVFEHLARQIEQPLRIAILETPAGFELNSAQVAARVANFLQTRLSNYKSQIQIVPARKRGTPFSPDDPEICAPLLQANLVFMGPGSPTYAIRQLKDSLAWDLLRARHRMGAALVFASAATIAAGQIGLPVYEIYKVGQDVHTVPGLGLFDDFGLALSFIPHWNNTDGGQELDTSRCFIGRERFEVWCAYLPENHTVVGLDEHTAIVFDFRQRECFVMGVSSVSLLRTCNPRIYPAGSTILFEEFGSIEIPHPLSQGISPAIWEMASSISPHPTTGEEIPPPEVTALLEARQAARARKDWSRADDYRRRIQALGWTVQDTPEGPKLVRG
ncbi:MAG: cysteinyl-tRNA synthetase [Anaerolineae bacterium]|nr:MAG: cysteinyl-tRNA synthetase [Anaerolineae bacterium]